MRYAFPWNAPAIVDAIARLVKVFAPSKPLQRARCDRRAIGGTLPQRAGAAWSLPNAVDASIIAPGAEE